MATYANAVYGFSLFVLSTEVSFSVFLNSYLEKNSQPLMRQVNQNLRETSMKDYNQLKVSFFGEGEAQISLQSLIHEIGGALIYCTDLNLFLFLFASLISVESAERLGSSLTTPPTTLSSSAFAGPGPSPTSSPTF